MELVLHNQHVFSFMKSMTRILSINTRRRMTPFCSSPLHYFLTSLVNLPSMISHVYLHLQMHLLLIKSVTHQMLVHHSTMERINYSLKIHLTFHLPFPKTQRVNSSTSHLPLYLIHQIMRTSMIRFY